MKYFVLAVFFLVNSNLVSASEYTFKTVQVPVTAKQSQMLDSIIPPPVGGAIGGTVDPGQVIGWGRDLVALGEAIYTLVSKGKPTVQTEYTPISIVPRDPITRNYVEPMELEEATAPIKRRFITSAKNGFNQEVVRVEYLLMFQVAKYNGKGKYILNAVILPNVKVGYGFDFTSQMKLIGVSNRGKTNDPLVQIALDMHYTIGSMVTGINKHIGISINGNGEIIIE